MNNRLDKKRKDINMSLRDDLGVRMKTFYEEIPKIKLMRRCPVIIRIDGKAFHTFTNGFKRPFDEILIKTMQKTTKYLCENIQGCVLGYTESDEITLVLVDYKKLTSAAWFDYEVQKISSIVASMATMAFNKHFVKEAYQYIFDNEERYSEVYYCNALSEAIKNGAMFDARCFNIPKEEVTNCIYWRQLDASRNSIQMVGQANFSHKELQNKSCNEIQDMLMIRKDINWNDLPTYQKRGSCVIKEKYFDSSINGTTNSYVNPWRTRWIIDRDIPIFKGEGREYIDKLIYVGEE